MASPRLIAWVERLAWICLYGGLIALALGSVTRELAYTTGTLLMAGGALAAVGGALLIVLRSRLRGPGEPPAASKGKKP